MNSYFTLDTILQGFVLVFFTVLGGYVFFTDHLEKKSVPKTNGSEEDNNNSAEGNITEEEKQVAQESIKSLNEELGKTFMQALHLVIGLRNLGQGYLDGKIAQVSSSITYILVLTVAIFAMGIFGRTSADHWMDKGNLDHLGNKYIWADSSEMLTTSKKLRLNAFNQVYKQDFERQYVDSVIKPKFKHGHYYFTKHRILHTSDLDSYKKDVLDTVSIIEYSQVFALSFFILYVFAWLNLISLMARSFFDKKEGFQNDKAQSFTFRIVRAIYRVILGACVGVILVGLLGRFDVIQIRSVGLRKYYFLAINAIPFITWLYLWYRYRYDNSTLNLETNPDITYRDLFFKHYYTLIFLFIGLLGYITASITWKKAESKQDLQVFGMYKNFDSKMKDMHEDNVNKVFQFPVQDTTNSQLLNTEM